MKITTQIKVVTTLGLFGFKCLGWRRRLAKSIAENIYKEANMATTTQNNLSMGRQKQIKEANMATIKSILNNKITKMVTRSRVLKATGLTVEEFEGGIDCFIRDFCEEGWCKEELRSIINTLIHLNREISEYGIYWF